MACRQVPGDKGESDSICVRVRETTIRIEDLHHGPQRDFITQAWPLCDNPGKSSQNTPDAIATVKVVDSLDMVPAPQKGSVRIQFPTNELAWVHEESRTARYEHASGEGAAFIDLSTKNAFVFGLGDHLTAYIDSSVAVLAASMLDAYSQAYCSAGMVVKDSIGYLVMGPSGSGKSSFCYELVTGCGAVYGGDDICGLDVSDPVGKISMFQIKRTLSLSMESPDETSRNGYRVQRPGFVDLSGRDRSFLVLKEQHQLGSGRRVKLGGVILTNIHWDAETVVEPISEPGIVANALLTAFEHMSDFLVQQLTRESVVDKIFSHLSSSQVNWYSIRLGGDQKSRRAALGDLYNHLVTGFE